MLTVFNDGGRPLLQANAGWGGDALLASASAAVGAFSLPANSGDAAVLATLPPGAYTAQISGTGGSTGIALVEVYEMP